MEESLKSIRLITRLIIAVTATLYLLWFAEPDLSGLDDARTELEALRTLDLEAYQSYVNKVVDRRIFWLESKDAVQRRREQHAEVIIDRPVRLYDDKEKPSWVPVPSEKPALGHLTGMPIEEIPVVTLDDFIRRDLVAHGAICFEPEHDNVLALNDGRAFPGFPWPRGSRIHGWRISTGKDPASPMQKNRPPGRAWDYPWPPVGPITAFYYAENTRLRVIAPQQQRSIKSISVVGEVKRLEPTSFRGWLIAIGKVDIAGVLFEDNEQQTTFLPRLKKFWDQVAGTKIGDLEHRLHELHTKPIEEVTVIGVDVPGTIAAIATPLVVLLLMLWLYLLLRHQKVILSASNYWEVMQFPNLGAMSGYQGALARLIGMLVLPILSQILVILRFHTIGVFLPVVICIATCFSAIACLVLMHQVRLEARRLQTAHALPQDLPDAPKNEM